MFRRDSHSVCGSWVLFGTYRPEDQIQYTSAPTHPPLQLQARRHLVLKLRHPEARDGDFVVGRKALYSRIEAFTHTFKRWPELVNC